MYIIAKNRGTASLWYLSRNGRWTTFIEDSALMDEMFIAGLFNPGEHILITIKEMQHEQAPSRLYSNKS